MADRPAPHQIQLHPQHHRFEGGRHYYPQEGPPGSQILAVITLLPIGGALLALAGLTLAGSVIGTLVSAPLFIIFSPVLVPAAIVIGLAVTGFLTSGAFGLTGLSSLSYVINCIRRVTGTDQYSLDQVGQKIKDLGQGMNKAHRIGD